jgi:predicted O-methyltransferase YrrM
VVPGAKHLTPAPVAAVRGSSAVARGEAASAERRLAAAQRARSLHVVPPSAIPITWHKQHPGSWLARHFTEPMITPEPSSFSERIEALARATHALGPQPLWRGYGADNRFGPTRLPDQVRTASAMGDVFSALVRARRPRTIVEFGTAFGVSGMYFLAGLEQNEGGLLWTFEPNETWAELARQNLAAISPRHRLTIGTFEQQVEGCLGADERIDLAFIDAIHTSAFVLPQLELVLARTSPDALVILDDIHFSSEMRACWEQVALDARFRASLALGQRVGLLELEPSINGAESS